MFHRSERYMTVWDFLAVERRTSVLGSIGTENRLKGDHPTALPQYLWGFVKGEALPVRPHRVG